MGILCVSCHKYAEDPFISLRNPEDRLKGTTWQFTSYQIYGVEHSHDFDNFLTPHTLTDVKFQFDENDLWYTIFNVTKSTIYSNHSDLSDANKTIRLGVNPIDSAAYKFADYVMKDTKGTYWTIVELYNSKFHISSNGVDIYFKKQ